MNPREFYAAVFAMFRAGGTGTEAVVNLIVAMGPSIYC
jgi:hypothetical protein